MPLLSVSFRPDERSPLAIAREKREALDKARATNTFVHVPRGDKQAPNRNDFAATSRGQIDAEKFRKQRSELESEKDLAAELQTIRERMDDGVINN